MEIPSSPANAITVRLTSKAPAVSMRTKAHLISLVKIVTFPWGRSTSGRGPT